MLGEQLSSFVPPIVARGESLEIGLVERRERDYGATQRTLTEDLTMHGRARRIGILAFLTAGVVALALAGAGGRTPAAQAAKAKQKDSVPGELLVGFQPGVTAAEQQSALKKAGASEKKKFNRIHGSLAAVSPQDEDKALQQLQHDPRVRYAEPNFVFHTDTTPNDPFYSNLWGLDNTGQVVSGQPGTPHADINAPQAWNKTTGSSAVKVAVIDSGIDASHPDLSANMWINQGENCAGCRNDGIDNDHNGYVDDWRGWNFVSNNNNPMDDNGHGTHVAGTIGAVGNNGIGVAGVNWHVSLMPLKFIGANGSGTAADAVSAILYAAQQGADVLNNSWGGDQYSQALADAISAADSHGSLFVAAAGNSTSNNDTAPTYPASYDLPNVVAVAATDNTDDLAWFSNYGRQSVALAAPGQDIYSTWPGGGYQYLSGTSMAAPHVSGVAALAKAEFPSATGVGLKALLVDSVDQLPGLSSLTASGGRLDAAAAVGCVNAPKLWLDSPHSGFDVESGTPMTVRAIATACGSSAGVTVSADANGTPISLSPRGDGLYTGTYTPSAGGPLTISVTASAGGTSETRSATGVVSTVYPISPNGPPVTVTTSAAGQKARLRFTGQAGERVSVKLSSVSIAMSYVSILSPDGTTLGARTFVGTSGGLLDTRTLPANGNYTILVDPQGTSTGSMTVTLYDVPPDAGGPIAFGSPATANVTTPGQNAAFTFTGQANQRVSIKLAGVTIPMSYVSIVKPDGTLLGTNTFVGTSGAFVDTRTLPVGGGYTILVDPQGAGTGSITVTLYDVPPDAGGPIAFGGSVTANVSTPGQNARITFDGQAGQRVGVKLSAVTISTSYVSLLKPDGTTLGTNTFVSTGGGFVDTRTLPVAGTYTILVDPQAASTGSMTVTLYDVPPDAGGPIAFGSPATANVTTPGQNVAFSFAGQTNQRVSVKLSGVTISTSQVSILKPDGTTLGNAMYVGTGGGFLDTRVLPAAGTYAVVVDPQAASTGSITITLYDVPPDATGGLVLGGPSVFATMSVPGQNGRFTFDGHVGQRLSLALSAVTVSTSYVSILKPDGTTLVGLTLVTTTGRTFTVDPPVDGTYAVVVDPLSTATGSMTLTLAAG